VLSLQMDTSGPVGLQLCVVSLGEVVNAIQPTIATQWFDASPMIRTIVKDLLLRHPDAIRVGALPKGASVLAGKPQLQAALSDWISSTVALVGDGSSLDVVDNEDWVTVKISAKRLVMTALEVSKLISDAQDEFDIGGTRPQQQFAAARVALHTLHVSCEVLSGMSTGTTFVVRLPKTQRAD
jgi:hypothetical protein